MSPEIILKLSPAEARALHAQLADDLLGMREHSIRWRLSVGWPLKEALTAPRRGHFKRTERCPLCRLPVESCHCALDEQLAGELPRPWPEPQ